MEEKTIEKTQVEDINRSVYDIKEGDDPHGG